ncbi:nucleolar protein 10 [Parasteatoda tepidariorum]|uniref:nucleolar protein 10 n=1 Tax=Parasteatoda tepidariorum TaxID=114398 RepID=UPI001C72692B|nr:nucleolar protein 10 [Parasteatoda tepidariorum]
MQVTSSNNIKIYNLSSGKSLPDWISERKRRLLQKKDVDIRRRIELIQDFEMPGVSTGIKISRDGKFIIAAGLYKPRIRCYDVNNLSMKFERCFDAEAVQFELLSDDYSKIALLLCDRTIEFHAQYGGYYKTRIPKFGRDMAYHDESCDLLVVGASSEIYRLNLEQGRYLNSYQTDASSINKIAVHSGLDMIVCGTVEGKIEAWDPRMRQRISILDCAMSCMAENTIVDGFPSVTSLSFKHGLTLAVGTYTGQTLLYDIRTNKPFIVKDNLYGLPIKNIEFIKNEDLVASLDSKCVKFWKQNTGKNYTTIQTPVHLNDLCIVPNSGLLFLANEEKKILSYFIPNIGPAPKWCCFLDNITEELEESKQDTVYDDYKFVTKKELEELHLDHLQGTNLLRAYMHGYFMDIRLYNKARSIVQPEAYKDVKKKMVRNKIESERRNQVIVKQLPNVNREYAQRLLEMKASDKKGVTPLDDDRFKAMFENPDYEIKETDEEYNRMKAVIERAAKKKKGFTVFANMDQMEALKDEDKKKEDYTSSEEEESEEEDEPEEDLEDESEEESEAKQKPSFKAVDSDRFSLLNKDNEEEDKMVPIEERLRNFTSSAKATESKGGNKELTFTLKKHSEKQSKREEERKTHLKERAQFRRPAKYRRK